MEGIDYLYLELLVEGPVEIGNINLGAITIKKEDRECIIDIVRSKFVYEDGITTITCEVEEDADVFTECKYDLTAKDLIFNDSAEVFVGTENNSEVDYIPFRQTLYVKHNNNDFAIPLQLEK